MINDDSTQHLLNAVNEDRHIQSLLKAIQNHMNMDVAFIGRFINDQRRIEFTSTSQDIVDSKIQVNDSCLKNESYCQKIIDDELPNIIPDTSQNAITFALPVTKQLRIGSYIGVPIYANDSCLYGTLCCYNHQPYDDLGEDNVAFLKVMAELIGTLLEQRINGSERENEVRKKFQNMLQDDKLTVVYQPIYTPGKAEPSYVEALARFQSDPYQPPNIWLDLAESVGLSLDVESHIINRVISDLSTLRARGKRYPISINASPSLILSGTLQKLIKDVSPSDLIIEVTEHSEIKDYQQFAAALLPINQSGFEIAVDDVGAGFSSLRHILELNAKTIKLDMSLVSNVDVDAKKQALIAALVTFANMSELTMVAEGVETKQEFEQLKALKIEKFQGYYFSKPVPLTELF